MCFPQEVSFPWEVSQPNAVKTNRRRGGSQGAFVLLAFPIGRPSQGRAARMPTTNQEQEEEE